MGKLKPELTAKDHFDLIGDEIPYEDLMIMAVWVKINRGVEKKVALEKHGITEEFYEANVERVLNT